MPTNLLKVGRRLVTITTPDKFNNIAQTVPSGRPRGTRSAMSTGPELQRALTHAQMVALVFARCHTYSRARALDGMELSINIAHMAFLQLLGR